LDETRSDVMFERLLIVVADVAANAVDVVRLPAGTTGDRCATDCATYY
jgi:hypothetical protein